MPSDHRSPSDIERDIERDRSELAGTISEIQSRFTPEAVVNEIARNFREHGGDVGKAVTRSVKQNPIGLALTGVGLAWMMFGRSYSERPQVHTHSSHGNGYSGSTDRFGDLPRNNAYPAMQGDMGGRGAPGAYRRTGHEPDWLLDDDDLVNDGSGFGSDHTTDAVGSTGSSDTGKSGIGGLGQGAKSAASGTASRMSGAASSTAAGARNVKKGASDAARSTTDYAARTRERLAHGTEDLTEAARERVVTARRRAVAARQKASARAQRGWSQGKDSAVEFFEEQPLVAGALALAVGAAIAAALPRTQQEDEWVGDYSDNLLDEAERIFLEERDKAEKVAVAALDETRDVIDEKSAKADSVGKQAVDKVREEAADAGDRIVGATKDEADRQDLGKPKT